MVAVPESARELIDSGALAHLATVNADGSPQVTCVWIGLDGDEIVSGHLFPQKKLENVRRDPRVVYSLETQVTNEMGLREYLVIRGHAELTEGGAADLLQRLAHVYLGPGVKFPPMPDPPPGWIMHTTVRSVGGIGPWADGE